jgi:hypothetical protein
MSVGLTGRRARMSEAFILFKGGIVSVYWLGF